MARPRYGKFAQEKNVQMLAMLAIILLKMHVPITPPRKLSALYTYTQIALTVSPCQAKNSQLRT